MHKAWVQVKPDGVHRALVGDIIKRFEAKGYKLVGIKVRDELFYSNVTACTLTALTESAIANAVYLANFILLPPFSTAPICLSPAGHSALCQPGQAALC